MSRLDADTLHSEALKFVQRALADSEIGPKDEVPKALADFLKPVAKAVANDGNSNMAAIKARKDVREYAQNREGWNMATADRILTSYSNGLQSQQGRSGGMGAA